MKCIGSELVYWYIGILVYWYIGILVSAGFGFGKLLGTFAALRQFSIPVKKVK
jgi:hypothetical protein